ncbi:hypothetical protein B0H13DRAFT_2132823, partial [Mycena leptocephala]
MLRLRCVLVLSPAHVWVMSSSSSRTIAARPWAIRGGFRPHALSGVCGLHETPVPPWLRCSRRLSLSLWCARVRRAGMR